MPNGQVPLWVTYSLAVIAILGPIGGALLGARFTAARDDKRWNLEREREEVRWERERFKLTLQAKESWRNHRMERFADFLANTEKMARITNALRYAIRDKRREPANGPEDIARLLQQVEQQVVTLDLVASDKTRELVLPLWGELILMADWVISAGQVNSKTNLLATLDRHCGRYLNLQKELVSAIRADLGMEETEEINPKLPFEKTS